MKDDNIILDKSFRFALRITKLFMHLRKNRIERELCVQLLKSGTSVGANVEEAVGGSSRKDFIHKLEISIQRSAGNKVLAKNTERNKIDRRKNCRFFYQ